jgi:MoxR-like ATPase
MPRNYILGPRSDLTVRKALERLTCGDSVFFPGLAPTQVSPHAARLAALTERNGWERPYYRTQLRRDLITGELLGTLVTWVRN